MRNVKGGMCNFLYSCVSVSCTETVGLLTLNDIDEIIERDVLNDESYESYSFHAL